MSAIFKLPTEGYLQVLSYVLISDIVSFQRVCKHFDTIVRVNQFSIYRGAAITHRYTSSRSLPSTIEEAIQGQPSLYKDVKCWKEFCQVRFKLDKAWRKPVYPKESRTSAGVGDSFTGICQDHQYLLLPTESDAGFMVLSLDETRPSAREGRIIPHRELTLASQGYLVFKITLRKYTIWRREASWAESTAANILQYIGTIELDGPCRAQKMHGDCLMMVTDINTLHIYNLDSAVFEMKEVASTDPSEVSIIPNATADISYIGEFGSPHEEISTTSIDFDDNCIFQCTNQGFRILSRLPPFQQLYTITGSSWRRVGLGKWTKSFTSNVYHITPKGRGPYFQPYAAEEDIVLTKIGAAQGRKSREWRWDVLNVQVEDGMVVMGLESGWIVGIPDYRSLISGERTLDDGLGCWVLEIGSSCSGMAFDGRRIVSTERHQHLIINLHDIPRRIITENTPVVRLERPEWCPVNRRQNMVLTEWSLCYLGVNSTITPAVSVVQWDFRAKPPGRFNRGNLLRDIQQFSFHHN